LTAIETFMTPIDAIPGYSFGEDPVKTLLRWGADGATAF